MNQKKKSSKTKWIVLILIILLAIPVIFVVGLFAIVGGGLYFGTKNTEEFGCAMKEVRKNERAVEILGRPIEDGYFVKPNIQISGSRRDVRISIPVTGSKSSGTLSLISFRDGFRSDFSLNLATDEEEVEVYKGKYPCE